MHQKYVEELYFAELRLMKLWRLFDLSSSVPIVCTVWWFSCRIDARSTDASASGTFSFRLLKLTGIRVRIGPHFLFWHSGMIRGSVGSRIIFFSQCRYTSSCCLPVLLSALLSSSDSMMACPTGTMKLFSTAILTHQTVFYVLVSIHFYTLCVPRASVGPLTNQRNIDYRYQSSTKPPQEFAHTTFH